MRAWFYLMAVIHELKRRRRVALIAPWQIFKEICVRMEWSNYEGKKA